MSSYTLVTVILFTIQPNSCHYF